MSFYLTRALLGGPLSWLGPASWKRGKLRGPWALVLLLGWGPECARSAGTYTTVSGFVAGSVLSWVGALLHSWWNGPQCFQFTSEQFAMLKPCNDCSHELASTTTSTTTAIAPWDFWLWIKLALLLGFITSSLLSLCICFGFRNLFGSNPGGRALPAIAGPADHGALRQLVDSEGFARKQLAQAQLAAIKQKLQGPIQE